MEKYIYDPKNGLTYELHGDYYLPAFEGDDDPEEPIGLWGQRHLEHLRKHKPHVYNELWFGGRLDEYARQIDRQANDMYDLLVRQLAKAEGITEQLKAEDQMAWVAAMNSIDNRVKEIIRSELIYA